MTELSELFAEVAPDIQRSIRDLGWHTPTPVQAAAIPKMREGGDLIVQAMTGSGKTGAFGIPLVEAIDTELAETQAIVLLPTRELANQVAKELDQLGCHRGVRTLPIYGGVAYGPQNEGLERGAHIIVGTPGRILDHLKSGRMNLGHTKVLVLDEADEMLSLGFWPDMKEIASYLPKKRQSHLFSATMPEKVRSLSRFFLKDPEDVTIDTEQAAPQKIAHYYYVCAASDKEALLARILDYEEPDSAIIFCNTKADVRFITAYLDKRGFQVDQISGDLPQSAREKAIGRIKAGQLRFLVATDVAARGIDISDLAYVINYSTSDSPEVYVHRTGRTGRAGKSGVAISLVSGLDIGNFKHMQVVVGIPISERKAPSEADVARRKKKRESGRLEEDWKTVQARAGAVLARQPEADAQARIEQLLPFVKKATESEEGIRQLGSLCAAFLFEQPALEPPPASETSDTETGVQDLADERSQESRDEDRAESRSRRRRSPRGGRRSDRGSRAEARTSEGDSSRGVDRGSEGPSDREPRRRRRSRS
jgi:ATP-dependent RNA helicase DeaD